MTLGQPAGELTDKFVSPGPLGPGAEKTRKRVENGPGTPSQTFFEFSRERRFLPSAEGQLRPKSCKNKRNILRTFPVVGAFPLRVATNFLKH